MLEENYYITQKCYDDIKHTIRQYDEKQNVFGDYKEIELDEKVPAGWVICERNFIITWKDNVIIKYELLNVGIPTMCSNTHDSFMSNEGWTGNSVSVDPDFVGGKLNATAGHSHPSSLQSANLSSGDKLILGRDTHTPLFTNDMMYIVTHDDNISCRVEILNEDGMEIWERYNYLTNKLNTERRSIVIGERVDIVEFIRERVKDINEMESKLAIRNLDKNSKRYEREINKITTYMNNTEFELEGVMGRNKFIDKQQARRFAIVEELQRLEKEYDTMDENGVEYIQF